ncbi:class I SAM-dependent methyltransferase [Mesorhizobium sp. M0902]|uniref:class I SAM-dependent DNA methyltransferase n=1 Tax=unclassified Mesorhizobium TaxID=325217 RepID=UPI00333AEC99
MVLTVRSLVGIRRFLRAQWRPLGSVHENRAPARRDYRASHQTDGYGAHYSDTFRSGYYAALWSGIEKPLVERILLPVGGPNRKCLDFACGTGRIANIAAQFFGEVVGVDISQSMLASARVPKNVKLVRADITLSPLAERFDVVTAFRFFLNAEDELRKDALSAISAHLNEGGLLISNIHMNATSPIGLVCRILNRYAGGTVRHTLSIKGYEQTLIANGFIVERIVGYGFLPRPGKLLPRLCEILIVPFERICASARIPAELAQNFLVVARKR